MLDIPLLQRALTWMIQAGECLMMPLHASAIGHILGAEAKVGRGPQVPVVISWSGFSSFLLHPKTSISHHLLSCPAPCLVFYSYFCSRIVLDSYGTSMVSKDFAGGTHPDFSRTPHLKSSVLDMHGTNSSVLMHRVGTSEVVEKVNI